jgi:thioredoxin 1
MIIEVTDQNFEQEVLKSEVPVIVDFWAEWCGPCKAFAPTLDKLEADLGSAIKIAKCNIDNSPNTPSQYNVRSIPTLMIFNKGVLLDTKVGSLTLDGLKEWIGGHVIVPE